MLAAFALQFAVIFVLATMRIEPDEGAVHILGFGLSFEPLTWRSFGWLAFFYALMFFGARSGVQAMLSEEGVILLHPERKSRGRRFGKVTGQDVVEDVQATARALGLPTPDRIAVAEKPEPNAVSALLPGMGAVVTINSNLLEILPRDLVPAVIAHEVGHLRRRDSLVSMALGAPGWVSTVLVASVVWRLGEGVFGSSGVVEFLSRLLFALLLYGCVKLALLGVKALGARAAQAGEIIADAHAAAHCGWQCIVSALLLLGQRQETLRNLTAGLADLSARIGEKDVERDLRGVVSRFPPTGVDPVAAAAAAPRLFVQQRLEALRDGLCVPLTDEDIAALSSKAAFALRATTAEKAAESKDEVRPVPEDADWRAFDVDASGTLDADEATRLVAELKASPGKLLFRQVTAVHDRFEAHPPIRDRVIAIYNIFASTN